MRSLYLIALVPALALAAPKGHKKPKPKPPETPAATPTPPPTTPDAGSASEPKPAEPPPTTPPVTTPAPATPAAAAGSGSAATEEPPPTNEPDVDSLRQEYLSLRDELFKSRARANAVASALYSTRITIRLTWTSGRFYGVSKAQVRLDGATVYDNAAGAIANDDGVRFDGYVAPGRHLITFHVEATGKDDDSFTSSTESQVVVKAVAGKDLTVAAKARDSGDIAYEWKKQERGSYGLGIDVAVKSAAPEGKKK